MTFNKRQGDVQWEVITVSESQQKDDVKEMNSSTCTMEGGIWRKRRYARWGGGSGLRREVKLNFVSQKEIRFFTLMQKERSQLKQCHRDEGIDSFLFLSASFLSSFISCYLHSFSLSFLSFLGLIPRIRCCSTITENCHSLKDLFLNGHGMSEYWSRRKGSRGEERKRGRERKKDGGRGRGTKRQTS